MKLTILYSKIFHFSAISFLRNGIKFLRNAISFFCAMEFHFCAMELNFCTMQFHFCATQLLHFRYISALFLSCATQISLAFCNIQAVTKYLLHRDIKPLLLGSTLIFPFRLYLSISLLNYAHNPLILVDPE